MGKRCGRSEQNKRRVESGVLYFGDRDGDNEQCFEAGPIVVRWRSVDRDCDADKGDHPNKFKVKGPHLICNSSQQTKNSNNQENGVVGLHVWFIFTWVAFIGIYRFDKTLLFKWAGNNCEMVGNVNRFKRRLGRLGGHRGGSSTAFAACKVVVLVIVAAT